MIGNGNELQLLLDFPKLHLSFAGCVGNATSRNLDRKASVFARSRDGDRSIIVIASTTDKGALYGAFHFLRLLQTEQQIDRLQIDQRAAIETSHP